jgi:long-chain acyl-CoA synthetase
MDLSRKPEVADLVRGEVAKINASLPAALQVKRILLLNKELEADDAEMTRTRKVRRRFVAEKYAKVIEAFYNGANDADVAVEITFEDGRKSTLAATIEIHDVAASSLPQKTTRKAA